MPRPTRRCFLKRFGIGTSAIALTGLRLRTPACAASPRPLAPFKTLYSNDTTHITSCISPYHQKGEPISDERLRASINEAQGMDVHLLQPGLGWIPWWQSSVYSAEDHYGYYQRKYGIKPNSFGRYMLSGGDLVKTFVEHCYRSKGVPFISYRLNDGHHTRELAESLERKQPSQTMSQFYWENYERYRIGPDPNDWSQAVFNWAIPEVREHKFAFIQEICRKYDIAGIELDFMRHWNSFDVERTTAEERCEIMASFVARVRRLLDETARQGKYRWLCARIPAVIEAHGRQGIDVASFVREGVDMVNLSSSYFTNQRCTDLAAIHQMVPDTPLYLEMTHTSMTGKAMAGSGTQPYLRTTDHQFYTTAHLAYEWGAAGVSLFNFPYYREHRVPELGPFNEPPFHVLPKLKDREFLAREPQWYFLSAGRNDPVLGTRPLPAILKRNHPQTFQLEMAPTDRHRYDGVLRLRSNEAIDDREIEVRFNDAILKRTAYVEKPLPHPYDAWLGRAEEHQCFAFPASTVIHGTNRLEVTVKKGKRIRLVYLDATLPT